MAKDGALNKNNTTERLKNKIRGYSPMVSPQVVSLYCITQFTTWAKIQK